MEAHLPGNWASSDRRKSATHKTQSFHIIVPLWSQKQVTFAGNSKIRRCRRQQVLFTAIQSRIGVHNSGYWFCERSLTLCRIIHCAACTGQYHTSLFSFITSSCYALHMALCSLTLLLSFVCRFYWRQDLTWKLPCRPSCSGTLSNPLASIFWIRRLQV